MRTRILYVEYKGGGLCGTARIARVGLSQTGRTLYYRDRKLQSLDGDGYKANYYDLDTGEHFWVSGPKRNGQDTLYPDTVFVDADARTEYWTAIRRQPENAAVPSYRSEGKYSRRKPR